VEGEEASPSPSRKFSVQAHDKIPNWRVPNATLVVVVVISSLKIPKAFLVCSGVQQNFAYTSVLTLPSDLPSQIFHLFSS